MNNPNNKYAFNLTNNSLLCNFSLSLFIRLILGIMPLILTLSVNAQDDANKTITKEEYQPFGLGVHLKNMHIWRGFVVQPGPIFATSMEYNTKNKKFTLGFWGGTSFYGNDVWNETKKQHVSANYKQFSIYAIYHVNDNFFTELVTYNNFTGVEERGKKLRYWSYDKATNYNLPALNIGYSFNRISLHWGITLFGQSRDFAEDKDGSITNSWSQYGEIKITLYEKTNIKLTGFVGGAWSTSTDKTLYTSGRGNVVNVGARLRQKVELGSYQLPVEVTAMWNPEKGTTALELDLILF